MVIMRALGVLFASLMLAACPGQVGPNTSDADIPPDDGTLPGNGVTIRFAAPTLPLALPDNVELEKVTITAMTIRALGDVASDSRTTLDNTELVWDGNGGPASIVFDRAPTGVYSKLDLRITGFELRGEAEVEGSDRDFEIDGESMLIDAVVDVEDLTLEGGGTVTFTINVDLASMLDGIDWDQVRIDDGKLTIEDSDPEMPAVRTRVDAAFRP